MPASARKNNEIYIERTYDAPVEAVWQAFNDPEQVSQWWGPRGHHIVTHSKDFRPGGFWKYTMYGPDHQKWENKTVYLEIEKNKRMVYDHGGGEDRPPLFRVTILFFQLSENKTQFEMTMELPNEQAAIQTAQFIKKASGDSTWDRLGEFLAKKYKNKIVFMINRTFNINIKTMNHLWTNPKHFSEWIAPTGFRMEYIREELKPGGKSFYKMFNSDGFTMYGTTFYKVISSDHLQYSQQFADKNESISRHPGAPIWPASMLTNIYLYEETPETVRIKIVWEPEAPYTQEEEEAFIGARDGMTVGWTGSFDKLEEYIHQSMPNSFS